MELDRAVLQSYASTSLRPGRAISLLAPAPTATVEIALSLAVQFRPLKAIRRKLSPRAYRGDVQYRSAIDLISIVSTAHLSAALTSQAVPFVPLRILRSEHDLHHVAFIR